MTKKVAEHTMRYWAFRLGGVLYVPHYDGFGYVAPGYGLRNTTTYTAQELTNAGATMTVVSLWKRSKFTSIDTPNQTTQGN